MESRPHIVVSTALSLMYVAFMLVQFNDPDPETWVPVYGAMVLLTVLNIFKALPPMVGILPMVGMLALAVWLWPAEYKGVTGDMRHNPEIEMARESLGLVVCAIGCGYVAWRGRVRLYIARRRSLGQAYR